MKNVKLKMFVTVVPQFIVVLATILPVLRSRTFIQLFAKLGRRRRCTIIDIHSLSITLHPTIFLRNIPEIFTYLSQYEMTAKKISWGRYT